MDDAYLGSIVLFAGNYAPEGWAYCDGTLLDISDFAALYSILGTTYGGDGRVKFGLPDLRGRVPVGQGKRPDSIQNYVLGVTGGEEQVILYTQQIPEHDHEVKAGNFTFTPNSDSVSVKLYASKDDGNVNEPAEGAFLATGKAGAFNANIYQTTAPSETVEIGGIKMTGSYGIDGKVNGSIISEETGGDQPHANLQPFVVLNYIICLDGVYPPRS